MCFCLIKLKKKPEIIKNVQIERQITDTSIIILVSGEILNKQKKVKKRKQIAPPYV
jgi:hypothetical protein